MMKSALLLAGILLSHAALGASVGDRTVLIKTDDPQMAAAIKKAQATLGEFLEVAAHPPQGASEFKVKVRVSDPHGTEYLWVTPFKQVGSRFIGIVADKPDYVTSVYYGEKISFSRSVIADWGYVQNDKQIGSFTVCVAFKHMPAKLVEQYREQYGFQCGGQ